MKKPDTSLFQLIKAMGANEKRYFTGNNSSKLIFLFNAIDAQKVYDEANIKKKFAADSYFVNHLNTAKRNLQKSVLKSLRNYHTESSIDIRLRNRMTDIDLLFYKGLYDMCLKAINNLKIIAVKYEKWMWQLEAIRYEYRLNAVSKSTNNSSQYLHRLKKEEDLLLKKIGNFCEYDFIVNHYHLLVTSKGHRKKKPLKRLFLSPALQSERQTLSWKARRNYHLLKHFYYLHLKHDLKLALKHIKHYLVIIKKTPFESEAHLISYIYGLQDYSFLCIKLKKTDEVFSIIREIKGFLQKTSSEFNSPAIAKVAFVKSYSMELALLNHIGEAEKGIALVPEIETGLKKFKNHLIKQNYIVFYFNIALCYFGAGRYRDTIRWLNKVMNETDNTVREDIQCMVRIINLIVHYELGREEYVQFLISETRKFLQERKSVFKIEHVVLNFFDKKLPVSGKGISPTEDFKELQRELKLISKDAKESEALEYFDFIFWAESKIENRPMSEIVKKKYLRGVV